MNIEEGKRLLIEIVDRHIEDEISRGTFKKIITESGGVPVRGILEEIRPLNTTEYSEEEKEIIDDLLYFFG